MKLRTQEEIIEKIHIVNKSDMVGWNFPDYAYYLDYEHAKEFLKESVTEKDYEYREYTLENVLKEMREYLPFAIGKAENERGISANRSMDHYQNWFWLISEDEMSENIWYNYSEYGMGKLLEIKEWLENNDEQNR